MRIRTLMNCAMSGIRRLEYSDSAARRSTDALHAATAIAMDCDAFLTNDTDFRRIQDLNVLVLDDLEL